MTKIDQNKILENKIKANAFDFNLNRQSAIVSALADGNFDKCEYLTRIDLALKPNSLQKARFEHSPLGNLLNKKLKVSGDDVGDKKDDGKINDGDDDNKDDKSDVQYDEYDEEYFSKLDKLLNGLKDDKSGAQDERDNITDNKSDAQDESDNITDNKSDAQDERDNISDNKKEAQDECDNISDNKSDARNLFDLTAQSDDEDDIFYSPKQKLSPKPLSASPTQMVDQEVDNVPKMLDQEVDNVPKMVDQEVDNVPEMVDQEVDNVPKMVDQKVVNVPKMLD